MGAQATLGKLTVEDTVTGYLLYSNPSDDTPRSVSLKSRWSHELSKRQDCSSPSPATSKRGLFIKQSHKMSILVRSTRSNMR